MANRFRLIIFLFLSVFSLNSFASGINPTLVNCGWYDKRNSSSEDNRTSCISSNSSRGLLTGFYEVYTPHSDPNRFYDLYTRYYCHDSYYMGPDRLCYKSPPTCPPDSTWDVSSLSCKEPEQPDLCESLAEKCETLNGSKKWITGLRRNVSYKPFKTCTPAGLVPGCNKGCVINSSGNGVFYKDQSGDYYFEGEGTISSETCFPTSEGNGEPPKEEDNPLPPSEPPEKPCKSGEYEGTVNGTKVCLPAKSKETIIKEETINNNDNSTTNINKTVKCENGKCTISETTTNKDSSGSTTGESTKETQVSQSDFCAQNPGSSVCKSPGLGKEEEEGEDEKKSSFSGSCSSNFNCEGDSVQCAIALEQNKTACKLFDESNTYFQAFKDAEASNSDGVESSTVDLASHVSVDSVIGAGACPADIEVTIFNQAIPFELSKFCPYFDAMGMLIMLGACIGCLRILGSG